MPINLSPFEDLIRNTYSNGQVEPIEGGIDVMALAMNHNDADEEHLSQTPSEEAAEESEDDFGFTAAQLNFLNQYCDRSFKAMEAIAKSLQNIDNSLKQIADTLSVGFGELCKTMSNTSEILMQKGLQSTERQDVPTALSHSPPSYRPGQENKTASQSSSTMTSSELPLETQVLANYQNTVKRESETILPSLSSLANEFEKDKGSHGQMSTLSTSAEQYLLDVKTGMAESQLYVPMKKRLKCDPNLTPKDGAQ